MNDYKFLSAFVKTECCSNCRHLEIRDNGLFLCNKIKYLGEIDIYKVWDAVYRDIKSGHVCINHERRL